MRNKLPATRQGRTHKVTIVDNSVYFTVNADDKGKPLEIINSKVRYEGEDLAQRLMIREIGFHVEMFCTAISIALQHNAPLELICRKFAHQQAGCGGFTDNAVIKSCKSIEDYIVKWLWQEYGNGGMI